MLKFKHISVAGVALFAALSFASSNAQAQWTGCGVGAFAGITSGLVSTGGPVGLGADGPQAGGLINCDYRAGAFVMGAEASYMYFFGDLDKLGLNNDWTLTGRLGVLVNPQSLLYAHVGWGQLDVDVLGKVNHWGVGFGNEFRIPNSPLYFDMRYAYLTYDVDKWSPTLDANAHQVWAILKLKFGPGAFGGKGPVFDTETGKKCDPKMANC